MNRFSSAAHLALAASAVLGLAGPAAAGEQVPFRGRLQGAITVTSVSPPIVNDAMFERAPPGLTTCTLACPGVVSRLAGTVAVKLVPVTVVGDKVVPRKTSCDPAR